MVLACTGQFWLAHVAESFLQIPWPLNYLTWLANGFYTAQLFAIIFLLFDFLRRKTSIPITFLFPSLLTSIWSLFPNIFYFSLANGVTTMLPALQGMEYVGEAGLNFMIALVNILGYQMLNFPDKKSDRIAMGIGALLLILWFGYGFVSVNQWEKELAAQPTKKIGLVQPNHAPGFEARHPEKGHDYKNPVEMGMSRYLAFQGADLIVWPEGNLFGFFYDKEIQQAFQQSVKTMKTPLIFHDQMSEMVEDRKIYRNSSIMINTNGELSDVYHKRKLVPFGEYTPIFSNIPQLAEWLDLPKAITAGEKEVIFSIGDMNIVPAICYEILFGALIANKIGKKGEGKIILTQSNDGWYGMGSQPFQHQTGSILRAVENRVPAIHIINNGPSSIVLPNGRTLFTGDFWKRGAWTVTIPFRPEQGGSFYSKHPNLFLNLLHLINLLILANCFLNRKTKTK